MVERDYVMRLIHEIIRTLIALVFGRDVDEETELIVRAESRQLYERLKSLVDAGEIEEAENCLWEAAENGEIDFETGLLFYEHLNEKSNDFLEEHHFSRKEVVEGICYLAECYGYGTMAESLLEDVIEE